MKEILSEENKIPEIEKEIDLFLFNLFKNKKNFDGDIRKVLTLFSKENNIHQDIVEGVNYFVRSKKKNNHKIKDLRKTLIFMAEINEISGGNFTKSKGMNYICENEKLSIDEIFKKYIQNAEFWINHMGTDFFKPYGESNKHKELLRTNIGNSGFDLTCKGGSGDGSFSLDYAITIPSERGFFNDTNGEMWRIGIDTDIDSKGERFMRIIKTGSGMKDEFKRKKYNKMRKMFHTTPHKLLTILMIHIAYEMGFNKIKALSTNGAMHISSLKRSKTPFNYSDSFINAGFTKNNDDEVWHSINDLQNSFYSIVEKSLLTCEVRALDLILKSFNNLKTQKNKRNPIKLMQNNTQQEIEKTLLTYAKIHNW